MPRGLVVVLVLVALLFVVVLVVGAGREPARPDPDDHSWVERFQFGQAPAVEIGDIRADCLDRASGRMSIPNRPRAQPECDAEIDASSEDTRLLSLESVTEDPPSLRVDFVPDDSDDVEVDNWNPEDEEFPLEIAVGSDGGTLTIACTGAPEGADACLLELAS